LLALIWEAKALGVINHLKFTTSPVLNRTVVDLVLPWRNYTCIIPPRFSRRVQITGLKAGYRLYLGMLSSQVHTLWLAHHHPGLLDYYIFIISASEKENNRSEWHKPWFLGFSRIH
jgi:hypothetical protein